MRYPLAAILLFAIGLLGGCAAKPFVLLTDPYWELYLSQSGALAALEASAAARGYVLVTRSVDVAGNVPAQLQQAIAASHGRLFLLSPLLSKYGEETARAFPHERFAYYSESGREAPSNALSLVSDPGKGFYEAGAWAARYVKQESDKRGSALSVCALFAGAPPGRAEARRQFLAGFATVEGGPPLHEIEVGAQADKNAVRIFLNDAKLKSPGLYVLASPATDGYALDLLKDDQTPLAVENWMPGAQYGDKVVLSLEEQIVPVLAKIVETLTSPADTRIRIPWRIIATGGGVSGSG